MSETSNQIESTILSEFDPEKDEGASEGQAKWDEISWNSQSDELELIEDLDSFRKEGSDQARPEQRFKTILATIALTLLASVLSGGASFFLVGKVIPQVAASFQNEPVWQENFDQYAALEPDADQKTVELPTQSQNVIALPSSEQDEGSTKEPIIIRASIRSADASKMNSELIRLTERKAPEADKTCRIKGNISLYSREKIYHVPGQIFYDDTLINPAEGERMFCSENEAQQAGWQRSLH